MLKNLTGFCLLIFMLFALAACSKFDAAAYTKAQLDATFKAEFDDYIKFTNDSKEDAQSKYDENISNEVESFISMFQIPLDDSQTQKVTGFMKKLYAGASYEVLGKESVSKQEETVLLSINPILNFTSLGEPIAKFDGEFSERIKSEEFANATTEEIQKVFIDGLLDVFDKSMDNIEYGDPQEVSVSIEYDEEMKLWGISSGEIEKINSVLVKME